MANAFRLKDFHLSHVGKAMAILRAPAAMAMIL
jgi:hypothetical protein